MKVAVILPEREPFSSVSGGALTTWVMEVYGHLRADVDAVIFSPKTKAVYPSFEVIQLPYLFFTKLGSFLPKGALKIFVKDNLYPVTAALLCKMKGLTIVHIHNRPTYVLVFRKILPKAKIILHMQNDHVINSSLKVALSVIKKADHIISTSRYIETGIKKLLDDNRVSVKTKFSVIYNGANAREFKKEGNSYTRTVLFSGRLIKEKGVLELIKAFVVALRSCAEAKLIVIGGHHFGDNTETDYIKELKGAARGFEKNISFVGFLPHAQLPEYYNKATIFACPSIWNDPFPLVVIEGMAAGLTVIATDRGGIPEALADIGIIVNPENTTEFASKLVYLLENSEVAKQLGEKARKRFEENFTWEKIAGNMKGLLLEVNN